MTSAPRTLRRGHQALEVEIGVGGDGTARLTHVGLPGGTRPERHSWSALPLATSLPDEAFFRRDGVRVTESGRHHLDLRHPAARWTPDTAELSLTLPTAPSAVLLRITPTDAGAP